MSFESALIVYLSLGFLYIAWRASRFAEAERKELEEKWRVVYDNPLSDSVKAVVLSLMFTSASLFIVFGWPYFAAKRFIRHRNGRAK